MPPPQNLQARPPHPSHIRQGPSAASRASNSAPYPQSRLIPPRPITHPPAQAVANAPKQASKARKSKEKITETFEASERKERICSILDSWEKLATISLGVGDSIPQTRLRYQKLLTQPFPPPPLQLQLAPERNDDPDVMEIDPPTTGSSSSTAQYTSPRSRQARNSNWLRLTASRQPAKPLLTHPPEDAVWVSENEEDYEETMKAVKEIEEKNQAKRKRVKEEKEREREREKRVAPVELDAGSEEVVEEREAEKEVGRRSIGVARKIRKGSGRRWNEAGR